MSEFSIDSILRESKPYVITIECKNGFIYRGKLIHIEENMNCILKEAFVIKKKKVQKLTLVFLRGSNISMFIIPDILIHF
ncbi:putative small nuclear ribonucleoprotein Sm D3 [Guillardia theta]|uniref:Small nuclear ribonucleoprotein Sm D3 n=1 Tax=Guillardia theta TaxID=55529 RepID=Q9AW42_GUITH|nr:putative small nuclear ribonucleoprotein Sm D3 [Guillardia theta]CAC27028.1 putative small nuclear ribonucleoprotein Sm D3 [Guillardia theta]|mmetsp:Transcript_17293/g.57217  ORF Transcript_17293/g.57217 Transcript_17293/m.57217 type:complete len:80 (+) Transcript_17293:5714-5953(+)